MARPIDIHEIEEFSEVKSVPASSITDKVLTGVKALHERKELEPLIREILGDPDETPHCPTELADILPYVHINGNKVFAAFILKGRSFQDVKGGDVAYQFAKLRRIPGLNLIVFGAVGTIHDDAKTICVQTATDVKCDYLIVHSVDLARLLIAYGKICAEDGTPFSKEGLCNQGHKYPTEITEVSKGKIKYQLLDQKDLSHAGAKRYRAIVLLGDRYPRNAIKEIVNEVTEKLRNSNYYRSEQVKSFWRNRPAQVVWLYVAADLQDIDNANWICRTSWIDKNLSATFKPFPLKGNDRSGEIEIKWEEGYEGNKKFYEQHTTSKEETMELNSTATREMVDFANKSIELFQLYKKRGLTEENLIANMQGIEKNVNELYEKTGNFPFPPPDCADYDDACQSLYSTVRDLFLYYSKKGLETWDTKTRGWIMDETINRFSEDLKKVEYEEKKIN